MARTADVVFYPEGREWRCPSCDFFEPEDARPESEDCPECGSDLARILVRTVSRPRAELRRF